MRRIEFASLAAALACNAAVAQDLYDTTVLRTIAFQFHDANWLTLLKQNYQSETNILADVTVDGVTYADVGVRIRGNTSYIALPAGSEKFSLNVEFDYIDPDQNLLGYKSLNLNNGWRDPTFCREVVYNNFVARFIPNPRANHVVVTLNGQNWGVYVNVQQFDKTMLSATFPDTDGLRIKCPNNPNGPGLTYNGSSPSGYTGYQIKNDGGLADPWASLIAVCNAVTNTPSATWISVDSVFAIDPSIWSIALENLLTDDDSYINKGADFMTYTDPADGRMYLLQTDANETFSQPTWSITRNFTAFNKPVLSRGLANAELRQRYMAHYRTAAGDVTWAYFEPEFTALRNLIDAAVQADTKKLYSYTLFQNNFTQTVNMPYPGLPGGNIIGIKPFVDQRAGFLAGIAELSAQGPVIHNVQVSDPTPKPADQVWITAEVTTSGSPVGGVELYYRESPTQGYQRLAMLPTTGDEYAVLLPVSAGGGQQIWYYIAARSANTYSSLSFYPERTEWAPLSFQYAIDGTAMVVSEWMYSGPSGEFVELTNRSEDPVDLTGWSMDDDHATPGAFDLTSFGTVQPGESVIVTEATDAAFRAAWGLDPSVKIIGELGIAVGNNFARNDTINLYDQGGNLVDRLEYGDQTFPGSIRTQNASGQTCDEALGTNDCYAWALSASGDVYGSFASLSGEWGTPGTYTSLSCDPCYADCEDDGDLDIFDYLCFLDEHTSQTAYADCEEDGDWDLFDYLCFQGLYAGGCG